MFEAWRRTKFEAFARGELLRKYSYDIDRLGYMELANITGQIFSKMKQEGVISEQRYVQLLEEKLTHTGHI